MTEEFKRLIEKIKNYFKLDVKIKELDKDKIPETDIYIFKVNSVNFMVARNPMIKDILDKEFDPMSISFMVLIPVDKPTALCLTLPDGSYARPTTLLKMDVGGEPRTYNFILELQKYLFRTDTVAKFIDEYTAKRKQHEAQAKQFETKVMN